jgi:GNAT superfamily N-acetyltransferase
VTDERTGKSLWRALTGNPARLVPLPPSTLAPGIRLRVYAPEDFDACVRIYVENEPGRLPRGYQRDFEQFLAHAGYLKLVLTLEDRPVAIGGIGLFPGLFATLAWLVFGLVHPGHHRRGLGTTLLLARLASLPEPSKATKIFLSGLPASEGFFRRFGFEHQGQMPVPPRTEMMDVSAAMLDVEGWNRCRAFLRERDLGVETLAPVPVAAPA